MTQTQTQITFQDIFQKYVQEAVELKSAGHTNKEIQDHFKDGCDRGLISSEGVAVINSMGGWKAVCEAAKKAVA